MIWNFVDQLVFPFGCIPSDAAKAGFPSATLVDPAQFQQRKSGLSIVPLSTAGNIIMRGTVTLTPCANVAQSNWDVKPPNQYFFRRVFPWAPPTAVLLRGKPAKEKDTLWRRF